MILSTTKNTGSICRDITAASRGKMSITFSCASANDVRTASPFCSVFTSGKRSSSLQVVRSSQHRLVGHLPNYKEAHLAACAPKENCPISYIQQPGLFFLSIYLHGVKGEIGALLALVNVKVNTFR